MRELKFRAWDGKNLYTPDLNDYECFFINPDGDIMVLNLSSAWGGEYVSCRGKNWIVEQYTGIKDKNGVEIYEGDLFQCMQIVDALEGEKTCMYVGDVRQTKIEILYVVEGHEDGGWKLKALTPRGKDRSFWVMYKDLSEMEIAGNIHQNPDLLTQKAA